jgi:membrane fusion protein (multidrug efflux system)
VARVLNRWQAIGGLSIAGAVVGMTGCGGGAAAAKSVAVPPPTTVSVVRLNPEDVAIYSDYSAQTFARDMVEVRGRVDGFIQQRLFAVGADVRKGQVLYELDRRPYQAEVAKAIGDVHQSQANLRLAQNQVTLLQAQADLTQAQANLLKAQQDVSRLEPLVKEEAASQQDLDNARAALQANQANVAARQANVQQTRLSTKAQVETGGAQLESNQALLRTSQLNLDYSTVRAPISGRIGDSLIPVGGLVSKTAATPLTTIVPLDPIWVRFKVSEAEYLSYQKRHVLNTRSEAATPLEIVLADGTVYPFAGHIQNTVNQVDQKTGTLELQATFPNPKHDILPGQFGRVRFRNEERKAALLVPQRAVIETQGLQMVYLVSTENKVLARSIVTGERVGERWIIKQGLQPGDRVVVEGTMKVRPGVAVHPQAWTEHQPSETK